MTTYDFITDTFDYQDLARLPEYQELCRQLSDFANEAPPIELSEFLRVIRSLVGIAPFADACQECGDLEFTWPYAGERKGNSLRSKYRCKNRHYWECTHDIEVEPRQAFKPRHHGKKQEPAEPEFREVASVSAIPAAKARGSRSIPQAVKIAVAVRDEGQCVYCGSIERLQYDHIIPWSKGGDSGIDNIQLLCGSHNASKRDKIIEQEGEG